MAYQITHKHYRGGKKKPVKKKPKRTAKRK